MKRLFNQYLNARNIGFAFLTITFAFLLVYTLFNIYQLFSDKYRIHSSELYKVGEFQMQDKAYYHGGGRSSSPRYSFQSRDGYSFTIESSSYKGINYHQKLKDTLQYHELTFTVYSDKETFEKYQQSQQPIHINVLQFQIGDKKYIDLEKLNEAEHYRLIIRIISGLIILSFLFFNYFKRKSEVQIQGMPAKQ